LNRQHNRVPLAEIAQADDWQLVNLYSRPGEEKEAKDGAYWPVPNRSRDQALANWAPGLASGNFQEMFKAVWRSRGCDESEVAERLADYLKENPGLANNG
jgi:hypothetical protein